MRPIKFRGLSFTGEWHVGLLSISQGLSGQPEEGHYISNKSGMPWAYKVRPETVNQFLGVIDNTGREIFEGDIVEFASGSAELCGFVEYFADLTSYVIIYPAKVSEKGDLLHTIGADVMVVIGNVYENPKLLK